MDRIDNDGNYEPSNIRFVPPKENARNTRRNVHITINGVTKILEDWCLFYGINSKTVDCRINRYRWPIELAITTPAFKLGEGFNKKTLNSVEVKEVIDIYKKGDISQKKIADKYGVAVNTINRILTNKNVSQKYIV